MRQGEQQIEIECALADPLFLVGLPGREIAREELMTAGLSKDVADMLTSWDLRGSKWCAVVEFEHIPPTANDTRTEIPIASINCVTSNVEIRQIVQSRTSRVGVTLVKSTSGRPALDKLKVF